MFEAFAIQMSLHVNAVVEKAHKVLDYQLQLKQELLADSQHAMDLLLQKQSSNAEY